MPTGILCVCAMCRVAEVRFGPVLPPVSCRAFALIRGDVACSRSFVAVPCVRARGGVIAGCSWSSAAGKTVVNITQKNERKGKNSQKRRKKRKSKVEGASHCPLHLFASARVHHRSCPSSLVSRSVAVRVVVKSVRSRSRCLFTAVLALVVVVGACSCEFVPGNSP